MIKSILTPIVVALALVGSSTAARAQSGPVQGSGPATVMAGVSVPAEVQDAVTNGRLTLPIVQGHQLVIAGVDVRPSQSFTCSFSEGAKQHVAHTCRSDTFILHLLPKGGTGLSPSATAALPKSVLRRAAHVLLQGLGLHQARGLHHTFFPLRSIWGCGGGYYCEQDCDYQPVYDFHNQGPFQIFHANTCYGVYFNYQHVYGWWVNPDCGGDWPGWSCSWAPPPTGFGQYWDPHACTYDGCIGAINSYANYHFTYTICAGWFCYEADHADIYQRAYIDQYGAEVVYNYGP